MIELIRAISGAFIFFFGLWLSGVSVCCFKRSYRCWRAQLYHHTEFRVTAVLVVVSAVCVFAGARLLGVL